MKFRGVLAAVLCGALVTGGVVGCKRKKTVEAQPSAVVSSAPPVAGNLDPQLRGALESIQKGCQVDVQTSRVLDCKKEEKRELAMSFAKAGDARVQLLPTLVHALASGDEKLATVAATVLYASFRSSFGKVQVGAVDAATAKLLIETIPKLGRSQAAQAVPSAVHAAVLSGQAEALYQMLDAQENAALPSVAYRHILTHGGMSAFPKVKSLVAGKVVAPAVSALESVRSATSIDGGEGEFCPWAQGLLADERIPVSAKAGAILIRCGGSYIDALLADSARRLGAEKAFGTAHARTLREACLERHGMRVAKATDAQCVRNRELLSGALARKELSSAVKGDVLIALAEQWPDAQTKKVVSRYLKDPDVRLAKRADDARKRIERAVERKKQEAAQASTPGAPGVEHPTPPGKATLVSPKQKPSVAPAAPKPAPAPPVP